MSPARLLARSQGGLLVSLSVSPRSLDGTLLTQRTEPSRGDTEELFN